MSPRSKREYIDAIYVRYKRASRKRKTEILNEFCLNFGYHRKHAIRVLNNFKCCGQSKPLNNLKNNIRKWFTEVVTSTLLYVNISLQFFMPNTKKYIYIPSSHTKLIFFRF